MPTSPEEDCSDPMLPNRNYYPNFIKLHPIQLNHLRANVQNSTHSTKMPAGSKNSTLSQNQDPRGQGLVDYQLHVPFIAQL